MTIGIIRSTSVIIYFSPVFSNLDGWFGVLPHLLFFDIPLLYYYINLRLSIIFCLSSEDIYLSLGIYLSRSFVTVSNLICCEVFEIFIILPSYDLATASTILLSIKSPAASAVFWIAFFETVLRPSVAIVWYDQEVFGCKYAQKFTYIFNDTFTHISSKRKKSIAFYKYLISRFN